jgi:hypothetical protein
MTTGMLGAPVAPTPAVLARLAVAVARDLLAVGAVAVVVVDGILGIGVGVERGHRRIGANRWRPLGV